MYSHRSLFSLAIRECRLPDCNGDRLEAVSTPASVIVSIGSPLLPVSQKSKLYVGIMLVELKYP